MITIIFGMPGAGKSSLNTYFLKTIYETQGQAMLAYTRSSIEALNETREHPLSIPDKPPIFADFRVKFKVGYEKWYEPYFCNGFYIGLPNERLQVQYLPPGSKVFLSEVQRYYYSRNSQTMPDWVSRAFEMHRHYGIDFYMDVQRVMLVDKNIRELCKNFIEVLGMDYIQDEDNRIIKTIFNCREFSCWRDCEQYLTSGAETYKKHVYTYDGNIFKCFDSFNYFNDFVPDEKNDFKLLPFMDGRERPQSEAFYYDLSEPEAYRGKQAKKEK